MKHAEGVLENVFMKRISIPLLCGVLAALLSCSGGKSDPPPAVIPSVAGSWEFIATSSERPGFQTGVEVNLQQGQVFKNGNFQVTGQLSAAGIQQILAVESQLDSFGNITSVQFGGNCPGSGIDSLSGVLAPNYNVTFTYTAGTNTFAANGLLSSSANSITGTYSSEFGSSCEDSGTFIGTQVGKLGGVYTGQLTLPDGTTDNVTATLSESSASKFSANLIITGTDNTSLSLSGVVMGNAFSAQGTFQSQAVTLYGYVYQTVIENGINQGLTQGSLYLVNATDPGNLVPAGTLTTPIPPP